MKAMNVAAYSAMAGMFVPAVSLGQMACPLREYVTWEKYEEYKSSMPHTVEQMRLLGFNRVFTEIEEGDILEWWVFAIEPGVLVSRIDLIMDHGRVSSDEVRFATWGLKESVPCPAIADPDYQNQRIHGKLYVVAFAHFPTRPKGNMKDWKVR